MDSQNNNNQIIAEKGASYKIDLNVIDPFVQAVKDGIISIDDMQRGIKATIKTFEYDKFDLNVIDPFVQAVKDGIISIDDMQRGIKASLKTFYYNEHMSEMHGRQICPHFTVVRKERTEKE